MYPFVELKSSIDAGLFYPGLEHYYENYMKGNDASFLGLMDKTELQYSMLFFHNFLQSDGKADNDSFALIAYLLMTEMVANPRFDIDEASFIHDQYGPRPIDPKNRKANSRWISRANRIAFSHDSWSRTHRREMAATPDSWGDLKGTVAAINTAGTVVANMGLAIGGTILFGAANIISGL